MIDWLSLIIPCRHPEPIAGGRILVIDEDGTAVESLRWRSVKGSAESSVQVRTHDHCRGEGRQVYVSGNPAKWFQGHNLAGSTDPALAYDFGRSVLDVLGLVPDPDAEWYVNRVDVTTMHEVGQTGEDVDAWLRAAERSATMKHRGRGCLDTGTLYYGKKSRRSSFKAYNKGREVRRNGSVQVPDADLRERLVSWCENKLRIECVARRMYLEDGGYRRLSTWDAMTAWHIYTDISKRVNLHMKQNLDPSELRSLTNHQRGVYQMWLAGVRLEQVMATSTFYRWRSFFSGLGVDLAAQPPEPGNVIPLLRELVAEPARVPSWMPVHEPRLAA